MVNPSRRNVTRPREKPTTEQVYERMVPKRCYNVADLVAEFESEIDTTRWTIRNRLNDLVEEDRIVRREHANGNVTYRRPEN